MGGLRWHPWSRHGKPPPVRLGRGWGTPRRHAVTAASCALATSGRQLSGWRGRWRWRVPQCFAASRCPEPAPAPSRVLGPSSVLVGWTAEARTACVIAGAFSPAAHKFLRALGSHKGQLLEFPSASLDPGVRWLREKRRPAQAKRAMATGTSLARLSQAE